MDCVFCKIRDKEIPKDFTYEDEEVMVFPDINPIRPVHLLIVVKKHIADFLNVQDNLLFGRIFTVAKSLIKEFNLENNGYRLSINGGGAQIIEHFHVHLIGPLGSKVTL